MSSDMPGRVTNSFALLQRLRQSFRDLDAGRRPTGGHKRTMLRLARSLGTTAVPLCTRELVGDSTARCQWAHELLVHVAQDASSLARIIDAVSRQMTDGSVGDAGKLRCMALLTELDAEVDEPMPLDDPQAVGAHTLREMCGSLDSRESVARTVDKLVHHMEGEDLLDLVDALTVTDPGRTRLLLDEMLARADIDERFRGEIRRLRAPLLSSCDPVALPFARGPVTALVATRDDERTLVVVSQRRPGSKPARWRALSCLLDARGRLIDALHQGDYTRGGVDRELVSPLQNQGYVFRATTPERAREVLCDAARATTIAGGQLAPDFYVGRDVLGIRDEHLPGKYRVSDDGDLQALLGRAVDLLSIGESARALPLLEAYVKEVPGDAHACSNLGLCLLALGDLRSARGHLERAVASEPSGALHHWNLASCAHREKRLGACYLSLVDYLCARDHEPDTRRRRAIAGAFVSEYERFAKLEYPASSPDALARAEDLLFRARELPADQADARILILRRAVKRAPTHHPSWTELGTAYADARRLDDARRSLERALALHTDYPPALEALQLVIQLRAKRYSEPDAKRPRNSKRAPAKDSGAQARRSQRQRRR